MHREHRSFQESFLLGQLLLIATLSLIAPAAFAQEGDTNNATTWYERALEKRNQITSEDLRIMYRYSEQAGPPSAEVRELMRRLAPMLSDIRRGSNLGFADFAPQLASNGFRVEQTGTLFNFLPFIDADIKMKLADGDSVGAASQIASMYRMMSHAGDGHTVYSSNMAAGMNHYTEAALDMAMEDNALGPAEMAMVLDAMHALDPKDPFQFVNGLAWQQTETERLVKQARQPDSKVTALDVIRAIGTPINTSTGLKDLDEQERFGAIDTFDNLLGQFIKIESSDDPKWAEQEIDRLKAELDDGKYLPFVADALRSLLKSHAGVQHGKEVLEAREAQLTKLAQGQIDPDQLANAAAYYRRGIAHLGSLDPAWNKAIESLLGTSEAPAETLAALENANREAADLAIGEFTRGSLIRRCDFSTRRVEEEMFIPTYADGMRRGFALLGLEALRLDAAGKPDDAFAQLATCFRMVGHLGGDGLILSAMESQDGFALAQKIVQRLVDETNAPVEGAGKAKPDPARLAELAAAIRRTGPRDPFGFGSAVNGIGKVTEERLHDMIVRGNPGFDPYASMSPQQKAAIDRTTKWLDAMDAAQRWYVYGLVMLNNSWDKGMHDRLQTGAASYTRPVMASILDVAEIDARALGQHCTDEGLSSIRLPDVDAWLDLKRRAARAAANQRDGMQLAQSLTEMSRTNVGQSTRLTGSSIMQLARAVQANEYRAMQQQTP